MTDAIGTFELWLEFEHVEDVIDDLRNIRIENGVTARWKLSGR
jgi:hypothetical protein